MVGRAPPGRTETGCSVVLASQIIRSLPESLDWMVLFDLSTLRRLAADETVRSMFFLPQSTDLEPHSHVVLTSRGTVAADREGSRLIDPASGAVFRTGETEACLYRRFSARFDLVPVKIPRERLPGGVLARLMLGERQGQLLWLGDGVYAVSLYVDGYRTISSALASLSLMPPGSSAEHDAPALPIQRRGSCHPRYRCPDHIAYIAGYALPPYLVRREPVQRQR